MAHTILITGSTDGIGLATAKGLAAEGHHLLLHGRSGAKLEAAKQAVLAQGGSGEVECWMGDLSQLHEVEALAERVVAQHPSLDVLINNAGVFRLPVTRTSDGLDARFAVNTIAPYLLTRRLLPLLDATGRVVNVSSAAQAPVDLKALKGEVELSDSAAYAQSKLALTMWSRHLGLRVGDVGPVIVAVNPGSLLGTKMVKEGYGTAGADIGIGADILTRAALGDEFAATSGEYYDNDAHRFARPHPDALDLEKSETLVEHIEAIVRATTDTPTA